MQTGSLVCIRMHILRCGSRAVLRSVMRCSALQQLKASLDMHIGRIKVGCTLVGIERICSLVVTRLILYQRQ